MIQNAKTLSPSEINVLVVDDEEFVRNSLCDYLEDEGYLVDTAEDGEKAIEKISIKDYDIMIVDMRLPKMDGNAVILKANELKKNIGFIVHTGSVSYVIPDFLSHTGIHKDDIIQKPISDMAIICDKIINIISRKS
jgi:two-component system, OmpR family, response regulator